MKPELALITEPAAAPTPDLSALVAAAWPRAQARWSPFLLLKHPVDDEAQPTVAHIHLGTRQVALHHKLIAEKGLADCVEAILAHEIGHHVRYPASLVTQARLRLLERSLLPFDDYSVINLFTDLLINETIGHELHEPLARTYQAFSGDSNWEEGPAFLFYMAVYEELWQMEPGSLMGPGVKEFEKAYHGYRADAQVLSQDLFALGPNLFTQFIYFLSVLSRYIRPQKGKQPIIIDPYSCGCGDPSPEDWAEALTPSTRELQAIERALAEGWLREETGDRMRDEKALERRIRGLPGTKGADATLVPEVMAAYYRQQAERYLIKPPPQKRLGEAVVPTTLDDWEVGDAPRDIDWLSTLVQRGPVYGVVQPLKRVSIADVEGHEVAMWQPRIEIYLDVSGSMPDPRTTRNAMTLAAQILHTAAIRAGGWARALIYSNAAVKHWDWCRSEVELSRFLMHYVGGGTIFPFDVLQKSVQECVGTQPIRVAITDTDFDRNYDSKPTHADLFKEAVAASPHFVLLLHNPDAKKTPRYTQAGARVVRVERMEDFPRMAGALSQALFPAAGEAPAPMP
jgi:hypothetical protein